MDCLLYNNAENKTVKRIHNKWWLRLHKGDVVRFHVKYPRFNPDAEVLLEADLTSGLSFLAYFIKKEDAVEWMNSCPQWKSIPVNWYDGEEQRMGYVNTHAQARERDTHICKSEVVFIPHSNPQETIVCKLAI